MNVGISIICFAAVFFTGNVRAQLRVDSVTVDSVWNSDTTNRVSRDCKISFVPRGGGTAMMTLAMSKDSGKTFETDSLSVRNYANNRGRPSQSGISDDCRAAGADDCR